MVQENLRISICDTEHQIGALRCEVWCVLLNEGLHPYHLLKIQHLLPEDYGCREEFSQRIIEHRNLNRFILYTDEWQFTHDDDLWAEENPHATVQEIFKTDSKQMFGMD